MSRPRKETHLMVRWDKRERDLRFFYPTSPPDGHLACAAFTRGLFGLGQPSFVDELKARGYDITTLRFSIKKDSEGPAARPLRSEMSSARKHDGPTGILERINGGPLPGDGG